MINAAVTSFSEAVSSLLQSFKLAYVIPAFIFCTLNDLFLYPTLPQLGIIKELSNANISAKITVTIALSFLIGYFLAIINIWIIRLFEGYLWYKTALARILVKQKQKQKEQLVSSLDRFIYLKKISYDPAINKSERDLYGAEFNNLKKQLPFLIQELHERFPISDRELLPTSLGNRIAAFEDYPHNRYNIDSVALWPRLLPILSKNKYAIFVEREKASFDFLLNLCFLLLIFALELIVTGLLFDEDMFNWLIGSCISVLFSFGFYKMSHLGVASWGMSVRVAFDLYRYDLLAALFSNVPIDFGVEKQQWSDLSDFIKEGKSYNQNFDYLKIRQFINQTRILPAESTESFVDTLKNNYENDSNSQE